MPGRAVAAFKPASDAKVGKAVVDGGARVRGGRLCAGVQADRGRSAAVVGGQRTARGRPRRRPFEAAALWRTTTISTPGQPYTMPAPEPSLTESGRCTLRRQLVAQVDVAIEVARRTAGGGRARHCRARRSRERPALAGPVDSDSLGHAAAGDEPASPLLRPRLRPPCPPTSPKYWIIITANVGCCCWAAAPVTAAAIEATTASLGSGVGKLAGMSRARADPRRACQ